MEHQGLPLMKRLTLRVALNECRSKKFGRKRRKKQHTHTRCQTDSRPPVFLLNDSEKEKKALGETLTRPSFWATTTLQIAGRFLRRRLRTLIVDNCTVVSIWLPESLGNINDTPSSDYQQLGVNRRKTILTVSS